MSAPGSPTPRRRRRGLRALLWILVAALGLRIALALAAVPIARAVAARSGIELDLERLDLDLLDGRVELWRLDAGVLGDGAEPAPLARIHSLAFDLDTLALLSGHVRVRRLELDGARIELARDADGAWSVAPLLARFGGDSAETPEAQAPDEPGPLSLRFPVEIVAARVQDLSVHLVDAAVDPPLDTTLTVSLVASDVGSAGRRSRLDVVATSPELLDLFRARGSGTAEDAVAELALDVELSSLRLRPVAHLLAPLGIEPVADRIDAELALSAAASLVEDRGERVALALELAGARLAHDGREALALDALRVDAPEAWRRGARVAAVEVEGARLRAERLADGAPALAGIAWRGAPVAEGRGPSGSSAESAPNDLAAPAPAAEPFEWSVEAVRVRGGEVAFEDRALVPAIETSARLEELTLGPLSSAPGAPAARLELVATVPEVVGRVRGSGRVDVAAGSFDVALEADGVGLARVAPYLALAGIEPALRAGAFRVASIASSAPDDARGGARTLAVRGLALEDGGVELGAIDSLAVELDLAGVRHVEIGGARLAAERAADGTVTLLGLRLGGEPELPRLAVAGEEAPAAPVRTPDAGETSPAFVVPELALPTARVGIDGLKLLDEATGEALAVGPLTLTLAGAEASGPDARAYALEVAGALGFASDVGARVRLEQGPSGALVVAGDARADGLALEPLAPWLALVGLEPALAAGAFEGEARVALAAEEGVPVLDVELGPLRLADGGEERLGLGRLAVERAVLGDAPSIGSLRIEAPRLHVRRDAEGGVHALGLRVPPEASSATVDSGDGGDAVGSAEPRVTPENAAEEPPSSPRPALRLGSLELTGARVRLEDESAGAAGGERADPAGPHRVELGADLRLGALAPGPGAAPTSINARLSVADTVVAVAGELVLDPDDLRATLALSGERITGAPLAPWLPPELAVALADGVASARLDARLARAAEGGHALSVHVADAELAERGAERPLAALAAARLDASRLDPAGRVFTVEELAVEGARLDVVRTAGGGLRVLGVELSPAPETVEDGGAEATEPAAEPATAATRGAARTGAGTALAPRVRLDRLDLELAELRVTSEAHPDAVPSVSTLRLALREPFALELDPEDESPDAPTLSLIATAGVTPGIGSLELALDVSAFADRPRVDAVLAARGIDGAGLLALAPELAADLDASALTDGTLDATLGAELSWRRRGRFDFDLSDGFGAELALEDVALRRSAEGPVELGVDAVDAVVRRIVPETGLVHVVSLDVDTPRLHARRTDAGLEIAGLVLRLPAETAGETPGAEPSEAAAPVEAGAAAAGTERAAPTMDGSPERDARAAGEVRIDSLVVHGADVRVADVTVEPPLELPIVELELDVRGFTTRALTEPVPLRFSLFVGAGEVPLPQRLAKTSVLRGFATGGLKALTGKEDEEVRYEERPFFQEASVSGRLTLVPRPEGWVRSSVTGFELLGLRGVAREGGVEIGDGLLDSSTRIRLDGGGGHVDTVASFSRLSLSEPDGGPISRYLKLPAPLDTVLFALSNEQGDHRIPLAFDFEQGEVGTGAVAVAASKALLGLITEALASAPLRAVGGVTDMVGLGGLLGGDGDAQPEHAGVTATIPFAPGGVHVGPDERARLEDVIEAMDEDELLELQAVHVFGPADIERAERLASPASHEAATLLRSLRLRRAELVRRRDELAASARAQLLLGQSERFEATQAELVLADRELGLTEDGIDRVAELLRPGAESRRERRTREAALAIARARMDGVSRALLDAGIPFARLTLRPPRLELPEGDAAEDVRGRVELVTRGGTPPKGWMRRMLGWVGL